MIGDRMVGRLIAIAVIVTGAAIALALHPLPASGGGSGHAPLTHMTPASAQHAAVTDRTPDCRGS